MIGSVLSVILCGCPNTVEPFSIELLADWAVCVDIDGCICICIGGDPRGWDEILFGDVIWVTNGTPVGAGAIGTNLVICGMVIGDCILVMVGKVDRLCNVIDGECCTIDAADWSRVAFVDLLVIIAFDDVVDTLFVEESRTLRRCMPGWLSSSGSTCVSGSKLLYFKHFPIASFRTSV